MNVKHYIYTWNKDNYASRQDAQRDGAITVREIVMPDRLINHHEKSEFIATYFNTYVLALGDAGDVFAGDKARIGYELVTFKPFMVEAEVLEWNTYTTTVYAETSAEATAKVKAEGIISFEKSDVECGTTGYDGTPIEDNQRAERLVEGEIG
ncbi:hypothetical protein SIPHO067v1_p0003 [Vibrio phage 51E28.1]|nr:hypothetical protein SIPHO068v1_p0098 [Vibrio phage 51E28.4]QZI92843.1 hypothetical protein SIPHO067v1_p0003 [Vibrio phage 51E28.1]